MEQTPSDSDIVRLFKTLRIFEPSLELYQAIRLSYEIHLRRMARLRLGILSTTALASLVAFVPAVLFFAREFTASGFGDYLSLIFSDSNTLFSYSNEFFFSLLNSLPVLGIASLLASLFVFLAALKFANRNVRNAFLPIHVAN